MGRRRKKAIGTKTHPLLSFWCPRVRHSQRVPPHLQLIPASLSLSAKCVLGARPWCSALPTGWVGGGGREAGRDGDGVSLTSSLQCKYQPKMRFFRRGPLSNTSFAIHSGFDGR